MAGLKRTDNRGRILKDGETQRKDGTYRYRYVDADGVRRDIYSNRLVPTDKTPRWCKEDVCLRDKEKQIIKDLGDGIKAKVENKANANAEISCQFCQTVCETGKQHPAVALNSH